MYYGDLVKTASAKEDAKEILGSIYDEAPEHWPNGLSADHFDGGLYLIREASTHDPAGFVGWQERIEGMDKVGYYSIGIKPEYRRRGFAKESINKIVKEKSAGVDRVRALVVESNKPSLKLADKLGIDLHIKKANVASDIGKGIGTVVGGIGSLLSGRGTTESDAVNYGASIGEDIGGWVGNKNLEGSIKQLLKNSKSKMHASSIDSALGHGNVKEVKRAVEKLHSDGDLARTGNYRYFTPIEKKSHLEKEAQWYNPAGPGWQQVYKALGLGGAGYGLGALEGKIYGWSQPATQINSLLNAVTLGVGGRKFINRPGFNKQHLLPGKKGWGQAALWWPGKSALVWHGDISYKDMMKREELANTNLAAAQARERAAKYGWYQDLKRWVGNNPGKATAAGITVAGLGAALFGSKIYKNFKKDDPSNVMLGKPGIVNVEVPKEKISDTFYRSLSRDLLFKDKKLNTERTEAEVDKKRKDRERQKRLENEKKKLEAV